MSQTPDDAIEALFEALHAALADEILAHIREIDPTSFEKLVLKVLLEMGYGHFRPEAGQHTGKAGDQGIDGLINEDELGLNTVYIQAKRWAHPVGGSEVRNFAGSLAGKHAVKGVLITTSTFSPEARDYVRLVSQTIVLIDGEHLARLMIKHNVAVTTVQTYIIKRFNSEYIDTL